MLIEDDSFGFSCAAFFPFPMWFAFSVSSCCRCFLLWFWCFCGCWWWQCGVSNKCVETLQIHFHSADGKILKNANCSVVCWFLFCLVGVCVCVFFYSDLAYALLLLVDGNPANTRTSKHFEGEISYQAKGTLHANWERVLSNSTKAGPFLDANALFVCKLSLSLDTHWLCMYQLVFSLHSLILFTLRETLARSRILHIQTSSRSSL